MMMTIIITINMD